MHLCYMQCLLNLRQRSQFLNYSAEMAVFVFEGVFNSFFAIGEYGFYGSVKGVFFNNTLDHISHLRLLKSVKLVIDILGSKKTSRSTLVDLPFCF